MAQKARVINGTSESDFKSKLDNWLLETNPEPVVNNMYIDLPNNRGLFIYSEKF